MPWETGPRTKKQRSVYFFQDLMHQATGVKAAASENAVNWQVMMQKNKQKDQQLFG